MKQIETTTPKKATKDLIFAYAWEQKKNGYSESTIRTTTQRLKTLSKLCDIREPEELKETITKQNWSIRTKKTVSDLLNNFVKFLGKEWKKPIYRPPDKLPFIPTEEELDTLISATPRKIISCLLQFLKETGARIGEATQIKWLDIDFERRIVHITPEKHSNARLLPLSHQLLNMLNKLERKSEYVFKPPSKKALRESFRKMRNKTAKKLQNPRLKKIKFHTFRHWKGTIEYHKTKSIMHVKKILGHKSVLSTQLYINIEASIFQYSNDEYNSAVAKTIQEAQKLIECGFEYVTEMDGIKLFRKRK